VNPEFSLLPTQSRRAIKALIRQQEDLDETDNGKRAPAASDAGIRRGEKVDTLFFRLK
jgi:hypothetical protein